MSQVFSAVKALIVHDGKILALKQVVGDLEVWDLPGGKVDFGESPYQTLHREVSEETGLTVDIDGPLGMWWFFRKKDGHQVICNTFRCTPHEISGKLFCTGGDSIAEYKWVTKEEFLALPVSHASLHNLIDTQV